jgi:hypothetical protein
MAIRGLILTRDTADRFLQAEHIFNLPFCNKAMLIFTIKIPGLPFYKIQVCEADKNIYGKQKYYLYVYRTIFFLELHQHLIAIT